MLPCRSGKQLPEATQSNSDFLRDNQVRIVAGELGRPRARPCNGWQTCGARFGRARHNASPPEGRRNMAPTTLNNIDPIFLEAIENLPDGISIFDANGVPILHNPRPRNASPTSTKPSPRVRAPMTKRWRTMSASRCPTRPTKKSPSRSRNSAPSPRTARPTNSAQPMAASSRSPTARCRMAGRSPSRSM